MKEREAFVAGTIGGLLWRIAQALHVGYRNSVPTTMVVEFKEFPGVLFQITVEELKE